MQPKNLPEIKTMIILHAALLVGQVLFAVISFAVVFLGNTPNSSLGNYSNILILISVLTALGGYFISNIVFQKKLAHIKNSTASLAEKLEYYRSASIIRWALIEFATLLSIVLFLVTHNFIILAVAVVLIVIFFSKKPSLQMVATDLGISEMEIQQMDRPSL